MGIIKNTASFDGNASTKGPQQSASESLMMLRAQSLNEIGSFFKNRLEGIRSKIQRGQQKIEAKKNAGQTGLDAYIVEDDDESDDDSFEEANEDGPGLMGGQEDPSKLIDLELVNLLRYCHELQQQQSSDEYQDEACLKSITLGNKTKNKTLIFDMDETLVAAKFEGHIPDGFQPTFKFGFRGTEIQVRLRPYV